jgi:hypothetical protein
MPQHHSHTTSKTWCTYHRPSKYFVHRFISTKTTSAWIVHKRLAIMDRTGSEWIRMDNISGSLKSRNHTKCWCWLLLAWHGFWSSGCLGLPYFDLRIFLCGVHGCLDGRNFALKNLFSRVWQIDALLQKFKMEHQNDRWNWLP